MNSVQDNVHIHIHTTYDLSSVFRVSDDFWPIWGRRRPGCVSSDTMSKTKHFLGLSLEVLILSLFMKSST